MTERPSVLELARAAENSLERNRARIDDLNVYPVPDGDTGTNMLFTVRAVREALEAGKTDIAHAALLGARGNSGVILSQIIRGAVEGFDEDGSVATSLRHGSDAAWAAVREPAEGTILTVIRELADEAESRRDEALPALLHALVAHGDAAVARTQEQLDVLTKAGVVDAGAAGLVEILRGIAAYLSGEPLPESVEAVPLSADAVHQEASRYRYCTTFVVEGENLDRDALERELEPLGDSLLVVGDAAALKAHVHTDDPGAALRAGTAMGVIERVEIANMHLQSAQREERLSHPGPDDRRTAVVAVVTGEGNRRLFESMGATGIVDGGETMNPSTEELVLAIESANAPEAVVLANNDNVVLAARQAARLADVPVHVVPSSSLQAGLGAMLAYDPLAGAEANAAGDGKRGRGGRGGRRHGRVQSGERRRPAGRARRLPRPRRRRPGRGRDELRHRRHLGRRPAARRAARRADSDHGRGRARARPVARPRRGAAPGPRARGPPGRPAALSAPARRRVSFGSA